MATVKTIVMKSLPAFLFVAALSALFVVTPFSFEIAISLFFAAGLAGIVACDYGREIRPVRAVAERIAPRSLASGSAWRPAVNKFAPEARSRSARGRLAFSPSRRIAP